MSTGFKREFWIAYGFGLGVALVAGDCATTGSVKMLARVNALRRLSVPIFGNFVFNSDLLCESLNIR